MKPHNIEVQHSGHKIYTEIDACRLCSSKDLHDVLDLGRQPPANSLRKHLNESVPYAPLELVQCGHCSAIQLTATVDPAYLFSKYVWVTGTSTTARTYSKLFCDEVLKRATTLSPFVVEIASNDGTFLDQFKRRDCGILGIDPAKNIAAAATADGIPTLAKFFDENVAESILAEHGSASVVIARNVIPHVKDIHSIIKGMVKLVGENGIVVIEFHYAKAIVDELHYDSIYHEHLFYFSLRSITALFSEYGLRAFDVFASPISGGSLVLFFSANAVEESAALCQLTSTERATNLNDINTWQQFGDASRQHAFVLKNLISEYANAGPLIGYGASARSSTLMNFACISNKEIACVIDRNPLKHGMFTPGTDIPIVSYEKGQELLAGKNLLLLAWNFEDEVVRDLRSDGFTGDIIVPLPNQIRIR
jgi:hypothetical protein